MSLRMFLSALLLSVTAGALSAEPGPPWQATGVKIGEVTPDSVIVWTRLTAAPTRLNDGAPWPKKAPAEAATTPDAAAKSEKKSGAKKKADAASAESGAKTPKSEVPEGLTIDQMEGAAPGAPGQTRVAWWEEAAGEAGRRETEWGDVDPAADFTRQFRITGLKPGVAYACRVESRGPGGQAGQSRDGRFHTSPAPDEAARVVFIVVTGQAYNDLDDARDGFKSYRAMMPLAPSFFVHTGDILYYDAPRPNAMNEAEARYKWQRMYSLPSAIDFHLQTPSYFIKDDHDAWQNDCWPTMRNNKMGDFTFEQGLAIFRQQVPMGDSTIRTARWGRDLQIWLPEGRDFRSDNKMPDGPDKTIWGAEQKAWFKKTVAESDATFRILISPTPLVGPDRTNKGDNHANVAFATEGAELREFIAGQKNMVVACGDRHWQYVSKDPKTGVREYSCGPLSNEHAGGWKQEDFMPEIHQYLNVTGGFLAGTVERVDGKPTLTMRHYSVEGKVLNEDRLVAE